MVMVDLDGTTSPSLVSMFDMVYVAIARKPQSGKEQEVIKRKDLLNVLTYAPTQLEYASAAAP